MQTDSIRAKVDEVLVWISWSMQILEHFNSFLPEPVWISIPWWSRHDVTETSGHSVVRF